MPTIRRMLNAVGVEKSSVSLAFSCKPMARLDEPGALDGKVLRATRGKGHARQLVAAVGQNRNVVVNQVEVPDKDRAEFAFRLDLTKLRWPR